MSQSPSAAREISAAAATRRLQEPVADASESAPHPSPPRPASHRNVTPADFQVFPRIKPGYSYRFRPALFTPPCRPACLKAEQKTGLPLQTERQWTQPEGA